MIFDHGNEGVDTFLSFLQYWLRYSEMLIFLVMLGLICIQIICGTFCQFVNMANRFLRMSSDLEKIISGGCTVPLLPTGLSGLKTREV